MRALVLSGGGSKGAYQIGVWKALKKLKINFEIVTGTSSGAINGALITQNSYFKAIRIWNKLNYKNIFGDEFNNSNDITKLYKTFAKNFVSDGGTEVNELHSLINKTLNKNKFYNSKINYGLVTFDLTNMKPIELEKKNIPKEKLGEYILASASCFPAFKKMQINGNDYIDGGYYDNVPINLAIKMGATEAIVVDLSSVGLKRRTKAKIEQTIIKPNNELSNFLVFDPTGAKKNMIYGYNDTLKVYGIYEGKKFTFKKDELKKFDQYQDLFWTNLSKILDTEEQIKNFKKILNFEGKTTDKFKKELINIIIEDIGYKFGLDDTKVYTCENYNYKISKVINKKLHIEEKDSILELYKLIKNEDYKRIKKEALIKPFDLIRAVYIYTIMEG